MSPVKGVPSEGVRALKEKGTTCVKTLPPLGGALGGSSTWDIPGDVGGREQIPGGWWMSHSQPSGICRSTLTALPDGYFIRGRGQW